MVFDDDMEAAALKIQSTFRGHQYRKDIQKTNDDFHNSTESKSMENDNNAVRKVENLEFFIENKDSTDRILNKKSCSEKSTENLQYIDNPPRFDEKKPIETSPIELLDEISNSYSVAASAVLTHCDDKNTNSSEFASVIEPSNEKVDPKILEQEPIGKIMPQTSIDLTEIDDIKVVKDETEEINHEIFNPEEQNPESEGGDIPDESQTKNEPQSMSTETLQTVDGELIDEKSSNGILNRQSSDENLNPDFKIDTQDLEYNLFEKTVEDSNQPKNTETGTAKKDCSEENVVIDEYSLGIQVQQDNEENQQEETDVDAESSQDAEIVEQEQEEGEHMPLGNEDYQRVINRCWQFSGTNSLKTIY
jgi:IQ calmodulin-binding motif